MIYDIIWIIIVLFVGVCLGVSLLILSFPWFILLYVSFFSIFLFSCSIIFYEKYKKNKENDEFEIFLNDVNKDK